MVEGVTKVMPITTTKEKATRRLEVKARSTLIMGIPNKHQLKFNSIKDAKLLLKAIEKRFEMLDQTFDRLQKLMSQLELLDEKLSQEDVNQKLLGSLSPEWNTHAVVWRNKAELETMSMDDLYNNLKVYEPEVKGMSSSKHRTWLFQPNSPQLAHEDMQQIHPDDIEDMDLRWQMAMLTMRARRRSVPVETSNSTALVSCDGLGGYDWSDQAEEGPNYALMAFSSSSPDSKVSNDSICSKSCLKTIESLKSQNDQLLKDLQKSELMVLGYKTVDAQGNMTREHVYLIDYEGIFFTMEEMLLLEEEIPKGGKIIGKGSGPDWLFDIDALTRTINYEPIVTGTQSNGFVVPKSSHDDGSKPSGDDEKKVDEDPRKDSEYKDQEKEDNVNRTNNVNAASTNEVNVVGGKISIELPFNLNMPTIKDYSIFDFSRDDEDDDHPLDQVIGDLQSATQTRKMSKNLEEHGKQPKRLIHALKDQRDRAMQEELYIQVTKMLEFSGYK
ncbi:hypothetical protein Tco_0290785 [Tanacetum coccineum]